LRIIEKDTSEEITETESIDEISTALALAVYNKQVVISKSMVPNLG